MSLPIIENSGVFRPKHLQNSIFPSGFPISGRPFRIIALKLHETKKKSTRVTTASLGNTSNNAVQEKEFQFKPSFNEYLKAMESVKSGREKQGPQNPRRNVGLGRKGEAEGAKDGKLREFEGEISSGVVIKEGKVDRFSKISEVKNGREKQGPYGLRSKREGEDGNLKDFMKKDGKCRDSEERVSNGIMTKEGKDGGIVRKIVEVKKVVIGKKDSGVAKMARNPRKSGKKSAFSEDNNGSEVLDMERAAFRPLEESGDAYDKPRVTRVDMEERIQKLAKCLNGADIDMPAWMFSKMMRSANIRFSDHSTLRIIQILGKLGNWRRVLQVIEWTQSCERFKSHKIRFIYTTALNVLGKSRRPVEALNLFHVMQQNMSSYPDLVAYRCIAVTLGQAGHMKELFYVIDNMRSPPKKKFKTGVLDKWDPRLEPDVVVYNAVLNACVRRKNWEGAFWVLQQLKQQNLHPSSTTYGLVMEVMFACGKYNLVHDFFRKNQKTCIPNALTYKVLLNTLWREGKTDEAILAVEDMERRGIVGTAGLYYDLARCLCSADRCQEALMQIDKICKVANKPLVVTYTGLIQACVDSGNIKNGAYIFNHMQNFCSPNLVTYNIMLKAFLDHGIFEEAKELFLRLLEKSQSINRTSDYKEVVMPDLYTFNTMLDACAAEQKWDELEFVYVKMLKYGYHFNAKRHLRMILDACNAGKGELLEGIWNYLVRGDQIPPFLLINEMFRLKLEQGDFTAALSCFACHPSIESRAFSTKWWLKFFVENIHRFEKDILIKLVDAANLLISRTDTQKLILRNLKISCMELLSKQMTSDKLDLIETGNRTHCKTAFLY